MSITEIDYELLRKAKSGDEISLAKAYEQHKLLIHSLLKRYKIKKEDKEDVFQMASMGLIKAIQNFDDGYNVAFSTYAVPLILGEIRKYFRENSYLKISRSLKEQLILIKKAEKDLIDKLNRQPTLDDIADYLNIPFEDVVLAYESSFEPTSIDNSFEEDGDLCLRDTIKDNDADIDLTKIDLTSAIETLDKEEKMFIEMRFFSGLNQEEIASRLFVSQVQVSRIEKKILTKLKKYLTC